MKQVAIYARVSTQKQENEKTIESQLAEIREVCKKDGVKIAKEYIDNGWSGETLARPGLDQLRDDASKGLFEAIYFWREDRLARDHIDQGIVERELMKRGVDVIYHNRPLTDENRLETGMKALFAEHEKRLILERTRRGRLYKAKQGIVISSHASYGLLKKDGHYEINKKEAEIVKLIFNLYIQLNSQRDVVRELDKREIKPRVGECWGRSTIKRILTNETYIGMAYYNKTKRVETENPKNEYRKVIKNGVRPRDKSEWIQIKAPSILDEDTFQTIQGLLKRNTKLNRAKNSPYLLSGLIRCGDCGSTYSGETSHGRKFYRCNNRHKTFPLPKECNAKMISAEKMENFIWNTVSKAMKNPKLLNSYISELADKVADSERLLKEERAELLKEKEKLDSKKSKVLDLYTDEGMDKGNLLKKMGEYDKLSEGIDQKLKDIEIKLSQLAERPSLKKRVERFSKLIRKGADKMTFEEKQEFLKLVIEEITFHSRTEAIQINGYIPSLELEENEKLDWKQILFPQKSGIMGMLP